MHYARKRWCVFVFWWSCSKHNKRQHGEDYWEKGGVYHLKGNLSDVDTSSGGILEQLVSIDDPPYENPSADFRGPAGWTSTHCRKLYCLDIFVGANGITSVGALARYVLPEGTEDGSGEVFVTEFTNVDYADVDENFQTPYERYFDTPIRIGYVVKDNLPGGDADDLENPCNLLADCGGDGQTAPCGPCVEGSINDELIISYSPPHDTYDCPVIISPPQGGEGVPASTVGLVVRFCATAPPNCPEGSDGIESIAVNVACNGTTCAALCGEPSPNPCIIYGPFTPPTIFETGPCGDLGFYPALDADCASAEIALSYYQSPEPGAYVAVIFTVTTRAGCTQPFTYEIWGTVPEP